MTYVDAIRLAHHTILKNEPQGLIIGLGVNYPNGADGTTKNLATEFPGRVLDTPISELAVSGAAVGMASQGFRPIVHHGRVEFALLAFDQILTQASRWNFMFGGGYPCPVVFRICIGRQWGNGPQHTANYHSIFLQAPGLDVYVPATPQDAFDAMMYSSSAQNPAVILEHRWLYKTSQDFVASSTSNGRSPVASIYGEGNDFTILTYADGLVDSLRSLDFCSEQGVKGRVICLKFFGAASRFGSSLGGVLGPLDNLVIVDPAPFEFGLLAGVVGHLAANRLLAAAAKVEVVSPPFEACPTSPRLVGEYYPNPSKIVRAIKNLGFQLAEFPSPTFDELHLPPSFDFTRFKVVDIHG